jgi:hypothetical protein
MMTTATRTANTARQEKQYQRALFMAAAMIVVTLITVAIVSAISSRETDTEPPQDGAQALAPTASTVYTPEGTETAETAKNELTEASEKVAQADAFIPDPEEVEALAKVVYREARGCSKIEQAAVIWCILNRVDSPERYFPDTILEVIKQPHQFAYTEDTPLWPSHVSLAEDVLQRWHEEKNGAEDVGRVLPAGYMYFVGDGKHNYFTQEFRSREYWTWSLPSPYGEE